nr:hypothetical protein [Tanacetum cinerariifolium]
IGSHVGPAGALEAARKLADREAGRGRGREAGGPVDNIDAVRYRLAGVGRGQVHGLVLGRSDGLGRVVGLGRLLFFFAGATAAGS